MHALLKKLGLGETLSAILMIVFGIIIAVTKGAALWVLVATYLIIIGFLKLLVPKK